MTPIGKGRSPQRIDYDWGLISVTFTLVVLGLLMVFSASFVLGLTGYGDPYHFLIRQAVWGVLGIVVMLIAAHIPIHFWQRWSVFLMAVAVCALLTVLAFGTETFGATRTYFGGSVQPSEPTKIITVIYVSAWLASKGDRIRNVQAGLLPFSGFLGK